MVTRQPGTASGDSFPRLRARTQRFTLGAPRSALLTAGGRRLLFLRSAAGDDPHTALWVVDLPDGEERLVLGPTAGQDEHDLAPAERARRERVREGAVGVVAYAADAAGAVVAATVGGALHIVAVDEAAVRVPAAVPSCFDPRPDPTGRRIAYVADRELRLIEANGANDRPLVSEGSPHVSWGRAEFAAAEEMDRQRGFWWAPDGESLLVARVDEAPVAQWWVSDPAHPGQPPTPIRYPAAGTANADVSLWLVGLDGHRREIEWDRHRFPYLARVTWRQDRPPLLQVVSRDQGTTRVLTADVSSGATGTAHEDRDPHWVDLVEGAPDWYGEQVVRVAAVSGARRLLVGEQPVTPDSTYVRAVCGTSRAGVVFTASTGDPAQVAVYRWSPEGVQPLSPETGVHAAVAAGDTVVLRSAGMDRDGASTEVLMSGAPVHPVTSYALAPRLRPQVRLLSLGERGLRAGLLLPRAHDGQRLPVVLDPYGGPSAQRVLASRAAWLEPQWLADQGFAVLVVDGRGTPGRDPSWEHSVHHDLAGPVLDDQIEALRAAAAIEPALDLGRVGIRGWSFGGYLAALAVLRRPDVFSAAVAGAPVTDWSMYDTFYTERFLGTPQDHPEVYDRNSLLTVAPGLSRPLLLVHGLADDNVVAAHTLRLSQRLTESGRPHQVLPLTGVSHMTPQESVAENLLLLQADFLRRHLGVPNSPGAQST